MTASSVESPSPRTRGELRWFQEARKRWEKSPRPKLTPVPNLDPRELSCQVNEKSPAALTQSSFAKQDAPASSSPTTKSFGAIDSFVKQKQQQGAAQRGVFGVLKSSQDAQLENTSLNETADQTKHPPTNPSTSINEKSETAKIPFASATKAPKALFGSTPSITPEDKSNPFAKTRENVQQSPFGVPQTTLGGFERITRHFDKSTAIEKPAKTAVPGKAPLFGFGTSVSAVTSKQTNVFETKINDDGKNTYRDRLIAFYKEHNPSKLPSVDSTLQSYQGREEELFAKLKRKYGSFPPPPPAGNAICFMEFAINSKSVGTVSIQLFTENTPMASENFRALCTGEHGMGRSGKPLHYKGSLIHRVVPDFCVQGGDFTLGNGKGGESIYKPSEKGVDMWGNFKDEYMMQHNAKGLLSMANNGPDRNNSQFFFTLRPLPKLNGKHVIFGRVVGGIHVLDKLAAVPKNDQQCLLEKIEIVNCGQVLGEASGTEETTDRGRLGAGPTDEPATATTLPEAGEKSTMESAQKIGAGTTSPSTAFAAQGAFEASGLPSDAGKKPDTDSSSSKRIFSFPRDAQPSVSGQKVPFMKPKATTESTRAANTQTNPFSPSAFSKPTDSKATSNPFLSQKDGQDTPLLFALSNQSDGSQSGSTYPIGNDENAKALISPTETLPVSPPKETFAAVDSETAIATKATGDMAASELIEGPSNSPKMANLTSSFGSTKSKLEQPSPTTFAFKTTDSKTVSSPVLSQEVGQGGRSQPFVFSKPSDNSQADSTFSNRNDENAKELITPTKTPPVYSSEETNATTVEAETGMDLKAPRDMVSPGIIERPASTPNTGQRSSSFGSTKSKLDQSSPLPTRSTAQSKNMSSTEPDKTTSNEQSSKAHVALENVKVDIASSVDVPLSTKDHEEQAGALVYDDGFHEDKLVITQDKQSNPDKETSGDSRDVVEKERSENQTSRDEERSIDSKDGYARATPTHESPALQTISEAMALTAPAATSTDADVGTAIKISPKDASSLTIATATGFAEDVQDGREDRGEGKAEGALDALSASVNIEGKSNCSANQKETNNVADGFPEDSSTGRDSSGHGNETVDKDQRQSLNHGKAGTSEENLQSPSQVEKTDEGQRKGPSATDSGVPTHAADQPAFVFGAGKFKEPSKASKQPSFVFGMQCGVGSSEASSGASKQPSFVFGTQRGTSVGKTTVGTGPLLGFTFKPIKDLHDLKTYVPTGSEGEAKKAPESRCKDDSDKGSSSEKTPKGNEIRAADVTGTGMFDNLFFSADASWKCPSCLVINKLESKRCFACKTELADSKSPSPRIKKKDSDKTKVYNDTQNRSATSNATTLPVTPGKETFDQNPGQNASRTYSSLAKAKMKSEKVKPKASREVERQASNRFDMPTTRCRSPDDTDTRSSYSLEMWYTSDESPERHMGGHFSDQDKVLKHEFPLNDGVIVVSLSAHDQNRPSNSS